MSAVMSNFAPPTGIRITPPSMRAAAIPPQQLARLAAQEPSDDAEAGAPPPVELGLTVHEVTALEVRAAALAEAQAAQREAEQSLVSAERIASRLGGLQARAGTLAAAAFRGTPGDRAALAKLNDEIAQAEQAGQALPTLKRELEQAVEARNAAFGALRVLAQQCLGNQRHRAAKRYGELAAEMSRCVAALDASLEVDRTAGATHSSGWHTMVLAALRLPALPEGIRADWHGIETMHFRDTLLAAQHPRLALQTTAARGRILGQIGTAIAPAGLMPGNIL